MSAEEKAGAKDTAVALENLRLQIEFGNKSREQLHETMDKRFTEGSMRFTELEDCQRKLARAMDDAHHELTKRIDQAGDNLNQKIDILTGNLLIITDPIGWAKKNVFFLIFSLLFVMVIAPNVGRAAWMVVAKLFEG